MNAQAIWKEELYFESSANSGRVVGMDSVPAGRESRAPSPMEYVLMGLAGCTGMDVVSIIQKMRRTIGAFSVNVDAVRAETHPKVFTQAKLVYELTSPDATEEEFRRAIALSEEKYCSVSAMLFKGGTKITWEMKLRRR